MVFTVKTVTIWNPPDPTQSIKTDCTSRLNLLVPQGLTDGIAHREDLPSGQAQITRFWTNVEAADDWVVFITAYQPQSVEVVLL